MRTHLEEGPTAWGDPHAPPAFDPDKPAHVDFSTRRWPCAIRLLAASGLHGMGRPSEEDLWRSVKFMIDQDRRRVINKIGPDPDRATSTQQFLEWVLDQKELKSWWMSQWGWRAPREFPTYRQVENRLPAPHVEPFEIAHWRIPDDISSDYDVVRFVAWCQGVIPRFVDPEGIPYSHTLASGLRKFHRSPWVMFALAAPHMQPTGVLFAGAGYFDSCRRLEHLLQNPFRATTGELARILKSPMFRAGYRTAKRVRKRGTYLNPAGAWYACGDRSRSLGPGFRRGGERHAKRGAT